MNEKSFARGKLLNAKQLLKQVKGHFLRKFYTEYHQQHCCC